MWMLQVGRRLDLGQEALSSDDGSQLRLENLEGDLALVPQVIGEIDGRHAAFAQLSLDAVPTFEGRVQACDRVGYRNVLGHGESDVPTSCARCGRRKRVRSPPP
jgi:hypothetical protein